MELKFTPRTIKEIEDITKNPVSDLLATISIGNLAILVRKGAGLDNEDQALDLIEKNFIEEGGDMYTLYVDILEIMQKSGFFPKGVDLSEVKEILKNGTGLDLNSLVNYGNQEK